MVGSDAPEGSTGILRVEKFDRMARTCTYDKLVTFKNRELGGEEGTLKMLTFLARRSFLSIPAPQRKHEGTGNTTDTSTTATNTTSTNTIHGQGRMGPHGHIYTHTYHTGKAIAPKVIGRLRFSLSPGANAPSAFGDADLTRWAPGNMRFGKRACAVDLGLAPLICKSTAQRLHSTAPRLCIAIPGPRGKAPRPMRTSMFWKATVGSDVQMTPISRSKPQSSSSILTPFSACDRAGTYGQG
jgi:hypothetical protein